MSAWRAVALSLALMAASAAAGALRVDSGLLQGVRDGGLTVYRGVPFAAPPIDALRWREPGPAAPPSPELLARVLIRRGQSPRRPAGPGFYALVAVDARGRRARSWIRVKGG